MSMFAPKPESRDQSITFRCSEEEIKFLDLLAKENGLSRAELIRAVIAGRIKPE